MKAKDVYTEKYVNYFKDTLTRLMATPSPSGYFREVNALLAAPFPPKGPARFLFKAKEKRRWDCRRTATRWERW